MGPGAAQATHRGSGIVSMKAIRRRSESDPMSHVRALKCKECGAEYPASTKRVLKAKGCAA